MNEILTVTESAAFLRKHPSTIRRWILTKQLKAKKIPAGGTGVFAILKTDLLEFSITAMVRAERKEKKVHKKISPPSPPSGQESFPI